MLLRKGDTVVATEKMEELEEQIFMGREETSVIELAMKQYKKTKKCCVSGNWFEFYVRITCWRTCCVEKRGFFSKYSTYSAPGSKKVYS